ncbi:hypothetical protein C4573_00810 [Candidatus Woesearchaeota archaeon]|nr:MAG: hypothetical protein C4573_00810 [Candidatus Woesearchaeota archaeon]
MIEALHTDNAPKAIGPYSQAIRAGDFVYVSGQIAIIPGTQPPLLVKGGIVEQTEQVIGNIAAILHVAGGSLDSVVKTDVYLANFDDFAAMNGVYASLFQGHKPARATVEVSKLPLNAQVEISCIAYIPQ